MAVPVTQIVLTYSSTLVPYPELRKYCIHQSLGIALKMEKDTSCIK